MALAQDIAANLVFEIFNLQRAVRCASVSSLREGTSAAPYFVLRLIAEGERRATRLADRLGVGASALSRNITELEERGLVIRSKDPKDARAQVIALTPLGADKLRSLERQQSAVFQKYLQDWSSDDAVEAAKTLQQLTESLTKLAKEPREKTS